jgi:flagellar hook-basal body complex protein FliE
MTVAAIQALSGLQGASGISAPSIAQPTNPASGASFGSVLGNVVDGLSGLQQNANTLAVKAVTGDLTDIHQATLAATRAQVTMELVSAVRNKGVDAFNEIMRMQA